MKWVFLLSSYLSAPFAYFTQGDNGKYWHIWREGLLLLAAGSTQNTNDPVCSAIRDQTARSSTVVMAAHPEQQQVPLQYRPHAVPLAVSSISFTVLGRQRIPATNEILLFLSYRLDNNLVTLPGDILSCTWNCYQRGNNNLIQKAVQISESC